MIQGLKPIQSAADKKQKSEALLKEFALGILLSNHGDQISFALSHLTECANTHNGIGIRIIDSELLDGEQIVVMTLIPKGEPEKPKSNIILLD